MISFQNSFKKFLVPAFLIGACLVFSTEAGAASLHQYVSPHGSGKKDGSSQEHAYDASRRGFQKCWDGLRIDGEDASCFVAPGVYEKPHPLVLKTGGRDSFYKKLVGVSRDGKKPVIRGDWDKKRPAAGGDFITFAPDVDYLWIENLSLHNWNHGLRSDPAGGRNHHVRIRRIATEATRVGMEFLGDAACTGKRCPEPEKASHDWTIEDSTFRYYTRRGLRLMNGIYDVHVRRCHADAGGLEWDVDESGFQVGFDVGDKRTGGHDITFTACTSRNNIHDLGPDRGWQGDGFKNEAHAYNLVYDRCGAFNNGDGGFDDKAGALYKNCVAALSKKNWKSHRHKKMTLVNCLAHHCKRHGGSTTVANLQATGPVEVFNSTFHNAASEGGLMVQLQDLYGAGWDVALHDSIYSYDSSSAPGSRLKSDIPEGVRLIEKNTVFWSASHGRGQDPRFPDASNPSFEGEDASFDSGRYGKTKGYHRMPGEDETV